MLGAERMLQDVIRPTSPGAAARILRFPAMSMAAVRMHTVASVRDSHPWALAQTSTHGPWPLEASAGTASASASASASHVKFVQGAESAAKISGSPASPGSSASCEGLRNPADVQKPYKVKTAD